MLLGECAALVALLVMGCGVAGVDAPKGASGGDGGGASGDDGAESSGGSSSSGGGRGQGQTGGAGSSEGAVPCGTVTCPATTQVCCTQVFPNPPSFACEPIGQCSAGAALSCASSASCAKAQVCCFSPGTASANVLAGGSATCQASCSQGQAQLCTTDAECTRGHTCQKSGAALPMACQDGPSDDAFAATTGGANTPGECTITLTPPDAGTSYQATCACPEGTCVCFGPSTTQVVSFDGCPFCPGFMSIGPTTPDHVFALCGFPR
jgi:hypothetical protein